MDEREMPAEQWTRMFPVPFLDAIAPSMISQAASAIFEMEDETESLRESRWYVTPSTLADGLAPMLKTWVMEFRVRNSWDEATEHGLDTRMEEEQEKLDPEVL